mgnify:CR=1 FL=1
MTIHISVYFPNGTSLDLDADSFMVDHLNHILAVVAGDTNYAFPLANLKYWKMGKNGMVQ